MNPHVGTIPSSVQSARYSVPQSKYTVTPLATAQTTSPHSLASHTHRTLAP